MQKYNLTPTFVTQKCTLGPKPTVGMISGALGSKRPVAQGVGGGGGRVAAVSTPALTKSCILFSQSP